MGTDTEIVLDAAAQALLFREARTANTFTDEPVSEAQVRAIWELVKWAPTGSNSEPLRVLLVRSREARERLVAHMSQGNKAKTAAAPLVAVMATDTRFHEQLARLQPYKDDPARSWGDPALREEKARLNAALQIGYFILGVRAAGLAAGPQGGFDADGVDREFFPDGRLRSLVVVNIGKPGPGAWRERLPRLDFEDVFTTV